YRCKCKSGSSPGQRRGSGLALMVGQTVFIHSRHRCSSGGRLEMCRYCEVVVRRGLHLNAGGITSHIEWTSLLGNGGLKCMWWKKRKVPCQRHAAVTVQ